MKILIVHDRDEVVSEIEEIAKDAIGAKAEIFSAKDYHSAVKNLKEYIYDLLIVDLTIPFKEGDKVNFNAVDQLLKQLFTEREFNIPGDVIGITIDTEALELVNHSLGPHLMVTIREDKEGKWKKYLKDKFFYAKRSLETRSITINTHYYYDALIITALDDEMQPYKEIFDLVEFKYFDGSYEFIFNDKNGIMRKGIAYSIGRSGQPSAASWSQSLITYFRPKLAVMSGICGGVEAKSALGDLVFFETVYDWDYGKWTEEKKPLIGRPKSNFLSRPNPITINGTEIHRIAREIISSDYSEDPKIKKIIRNLSNGKLESINIHLGPVGSGSAVVADEKIIGRVRDLNDSICAVDMESYGFYHASTYTNVVKPNFICVKAVSDFCNVSKNDYYHEVCNNLSADVIVNILKNYWSF